jgi:DMSO/TMAO reductase YedYZ heme-binding membrane subunit
VAAEHATKIYAVAIISIIVIIAFLALTSIGHVVDAATQHFMLFYAGVFALIGLCASVGLGLVATDRMFLNPGRRVFIQSAHRAASFGAVAFLIIHIITEILAQRVHALDAVIPFLSPFRTFYIGLGTIASDLIILLVITGILRGRFNASGKAWRWRAIHYASYLSFVFGVWHGLLGGRPGKPYVDWSYGFVIAFVLLGLAVRVLSNSLRPKESLSAPPVDQSASSASAPLRAAAMLAQYGAARGGRTAILGTGTGTGAQAVLSAPLGAPVLTALPAGSGATDAAQPYYEPGYEGPPRYLGAPRATGSGPMPRAATGPMPRAATGSFPRTAAGTGPMPRMGSGPTPPARTGPLPQSASGPMPRSATGPQQRPGTGPVRRPATGPTPRPATGPMPRPATGPMPRPATGPIPRSATGPRPRPGTGSFPTDPGRPRSSQAWPETGPMPRPATGPHPRGGDGRAADWPTGPNTWPGSAPVPPGPSPRSTGGHRPRAASGPMAPGTGPQSWPPTGPLPRAGGPMPEAGRFGGYDGGQYDGGQYDRGQRDRQAWPAAGHDGSWYPGESHWDEEPQWDGGFPETDPNLRYREPGPGMPGYRGSRDQRYGGDRYL